MKLYQKHFFKQVAVDNRTTLCYEHFSPLYRSLRPGPFQQGSTHHCGQVKLSMAKMTLSPPKDPIITPDLVHTRRGYVHVWALIM